MRDAITTDANYNKNHVNHEVSYDSWLKAVLDNPLMCIMVLKAARNKKGSITDFEYVFVNKKAESSVNRYNLAGKYFLDVFPGAAKSGLFDSYVNVVETGNPWEDEIYYNHDGYNFWSAVKATKLEDGCLVMYSDVIERKKTNEKSATKEKEVPTDPSTEAMFLGTTPATRRSYKRAVTAGVLLFVAFALTIPLAQQQLSALPAYAPLYNMAVIVLDLIAAFLLYAQFRQLRERSFLVLTCGYLFTPFMLIAHTLSFPDAFIKGSMIGGSQTTAWLWMGWHALFPLFIIGYAFFRRYETLQRISKVPEGSREPIFAFGATFALALSIILLTTAGESLLPVLMHGNQYRSSNTNAVLAASGLFHLLAIGLVVFFTKLRRLIDVWLVVSLIALFIAISLSAILVTGRYQVGFYLGRVYGLIGVGIVLSVLLRETLVLFENTVKSAFKLRESEQLLASELRERVAADQQLKDLNNSLENMVKERTLKLLEANKQLTEQTDYIQKLVNNLPDTVMIFAIPEQRSLFSNSEVYNLYGYTPDEMQEAGPELMKRFVHPDDLPEQTRLLQDLLAQKEGYVQETICRIHHKNGRWRWVQTRRVVFKRNREEGVNQIITISRDITPLIEADEKIKEQNRFITSITETVPDIISVISLPARDLVYFNQQPYSVLGFDSADMIKMGTKARHELIHPDDLPALDSYFNDILHMKNGDNATLEYRAKNKAGEWVWLRARGNVFERDTDGNVKSCINVLQNTTAQKEAEEKLKKTNILLESILNVSPNSLNVLKSIRNNNEIVDFEYILANKVVEDGIGQGSLKGRTYTDVFANVKDTGWFTILKDVVEHNSINEFEKTYNLSGKEEWFHVIAQKFDDGVIVTSANITQRKEAERKLKEQALFVERITESVPDFITVTDLPFPKLRYINKATFDNQGFTSKEIRAMSLEERIDLIHPDDYSKLLAYYEGFTKLSDNDVATIRYRRRNKASDWLWFQSHGKVFQRDKKGRAISSVNIVRNITDQIKAEEALREQSHFIQQITDNSPDILYVYDLPDDRIVYINKGIVFSMGYTPDEVYAMGNKISRKLMHPKDYNKRISKLTDLSSIQPGEISDMEIRMKDVKGKWHWFNIRETFFKANHDGSTRQILGIGQDITDKKEVLAAFKEEKDRNEELQRINDLMDTFVYAAAHDLKAPVANLKLVTDAIGNSSDDSLKLKLQDKYPSIIKALDSTISGLVNVLAIEKKSDNNIVKDLRFQDVYNTIFYELGERIVEVNPQIALNFSIIPSISYIESYLVSIFRNMLSNAFKYRSPERNLQISIETKRRGKYTLLSFQDNGIGIDMDYYGNDLFKPFKRFTNNTEGSGIGLHLIRNMITKNGGKIEVESKVGVGSIFKIYLVPYNK